METAPQPRPDLFVQAVSHLSHAQVVLSVAHRPEPFWCDVLDKLLAKPIYLCARGETSQPITDVEGRPLPLPVGRRRGEAVGTGHIPARVRSMVQVRRKHDPRIIRLLINYNPKQPNSKAYSRFALYTDGLSVSQFKAAGGTTQDLAHDSSQGYIRLELP